MQHNFFGKPWGAKPSSSTGLTCRFASLLYLLQRSFVSSFNRLLEEVIRFGVVTSTQFSRNDAFAQVALNQLGFHQCGIAVLAQQVNHAIKPVLEHLVVVLTLLFLLVKTHPSGLKLLCKPLALCVLHGLNSLQLPHGRGSGNAAKQDSRHQASSRVLGIVTCPVLGCLKDFPLLQAGFQFPPRTPHATGDITLCFSSLADCLLVTLKSTQLRLCFSLGTLLEQCRHLPTGHGTPSLNRWCSAKTGQPLRQSAQSVWQGAGLRVFDCH